MLCKWCQPQAVFFFGGGGAVWEVAVSIKEVVASSFDDFSERHTFSSVTSEFAIEEHSSYISCAVSGSDSSSASICEVVCLNVYSWI